MPWSHPAWVCGLKRKSDVDIYKNEQVTPCVGVWIETSSELPLINISRVTPCVGVWIETKVMRYGTQEQEVTPCVGVWIETPDGRLIEALYTSHPAWVCGLKHPNNDSYVSIRGHTLRGCVD